MDAADLKNPKLVIPRSTAPLGHPGVHAAPTSKSRIFLCTGVGPISGWGGQRGSSPGVGSGGGGRVLLEAGSPKQVEERSFQSTAKRGQIFFSLPNPDSNNIIIIIML